MFTKHPAILKSGKLRVKPRFIPSQEFEEEPEEGISTFSNIESNKVKERSFESSIRNTACSPSVSIAPLFPDCYYFDSVYVEKAKNKKPEKILYEGDVCERLKRCNMADLDTLTCLVGHCQRTFKECFTLAFHLSYSHIGDDRPMMESICLLCGKICTNGRSLSLHSHLSHREVSSRHAAEMRALSRNVDCQAAANKERMQILQEKSKMFELPDVNFPETIRFPNYHPQTVQKISSSTTSKTRVFNLPLKRCEMVIVPSTDSNDSDNNRTRSATGFYSADDEDERERIEAENHSALPVTITSLPVDIIDAIEHQEQQEEDLGFELGNGNDAECSVENNALGTNYEVDGDQPDVKVPSGFRHTLTKALQKAQPTRNKMHSTQTTTMTLADIESDMRLNNATRKRPLYEFESVEYLPTNRPPKLTKRSCDERLMLVAEDMSTSNDGQILSMQWSQDIDLN